MIKREDGFTLLELMITMIAFVIVIASVSSIFLGLVNQFKQQSKIAETSLEGLTGLEILRQDMEQAGYGLPQNVTGIADGDGDGNLWDELPNYLEATGAASAYNDAPQNAPRAIFSGNNIGLNNSDYLVIKSTYVARNDASKKWTTLRTVGTRTWVPDRENVNKNDDGTLNNNVRVITIAPGSTDANSQTLVSGAAAFSTTFASVTAAPWQPTDPNETRLVYGIDPSTNLRMPFNRADYFITTVDSDGTNITPQRCAPNTGVLVKAVVPHDDGNFDDFMPLLDCVADIQVDFWLDTDADGNINWPPSDNISGLTAQQIREQLKEIRVYIVAHEGQRDVNYDFSMNNTREDLSTLEVLGGNSRTITFVNLKTIIGDPDYKNYRWKVYTIVVNPNNLGQT